MPNTLLERYDAEMRREPAVGPGLKVVREGGRVRVTGLYQCVVYSDFGRADAEAEVAQEVRALKARGGRLEWKVHGHDRPADLPLILARHGFVPEPMETLLVRVIDEGLLRAPGSAEITTRAVTTEAGAEDYLRAVTAAFGQTFGETRDDLLARVRRGEGALHVAYVDGAPVGAGRVELPPGRSFAGLYTGGVAPAYRGRGVYGALVRSRAQVAAERGYAHLMTEALETSRPILERLGFEPLTTVQGWVRDTEAPCDR